MGLVADLAGAKVAVDTALFIYLIEEHPRFLPVVEELFAQADRGDRTLITSALTLLEVLVVPYRLGDSELAERYEQILSNSRGVHLVELTRVQLRTAAQIRASTGARTPDALQIAAAVTTGCDALITNDRRLPEVAGMRIVQLSSYAS
jgi:predicted nucleic acid-binding protein